MGHFHVRCPHCEKLFLLAYHDPKEGQKPTVMVDYCLSGGVYTLEVICPHCGHTEDLL